MSSISTSGPSTQPSRPSPTPEQTARKQSNISRIVGILDHLSPTTVAHLCTLVEAATHTDPAEQGCVNALLSTTSARARGIIGIVSENDVRADEAFSMPKVDRSRIIEALRSYDYPNGKGIEWVTLALEEGSDRTFVFKVGVCLSWTSITPEQFAEHPVHAILAESGFGLYYPMQGDAFDPVGMEGIHGLTGAYITHTIRPGVVRRVMGTAVVVIPAIVVPTHQKPQ